MTTIWLFKYSVVINEDHLNENEQRLLIQFIMIKEQSLSFAFRRYTKVAGEFKNLIVETNGKGYSSALRVVGWGSLR